MKRWALFFCGVCIFLGLITGAFGAEIEVVDPTDGQEDLPNAYTLLWKVTSDDEEISSLYTYNIYFGSTAGALTTPVSRDLGVPAYTVSNLDYDTTYFWKVEALSGDETLVSGIWRFTTWNGDTLTFEVVAPGDISGITDPEEISNSGVTVEQNLQWRCTVGGLLMNGLTYSVRLGTSGSNMPAVATGVTDMIYDPTLDYDTIYYWQIVAQNAEGRTWTGPIWKFYTLPKGTMGGGGCSLGTLSFGGILLLLPLGYGVRRKMRR